jgi:hypothetical protein
MQISHLILFAREPIPDTSLHKKIPKRQTLTKLILHMRKLSLRTEANFPKTHSWEVVKSSFRPQNVQPQNLGSFHSLSLRVICQSLEIKWGYLMFSRWEQRTTTTLLMDEIPFMLSLPCSKPCDGGCGSCYLIPHWLLNVCFLSLARCVLRAGSTSQYCLPSSF